MKNDYSIDSVIVSFEAEYGNEDCALNYLFKKMRKNESYEEIMTKAIVLNRFYSTRIKRESFGILVEHIRSIKDIDERMENGDWTLVDEISKTPERINDCPVFASKYCSFHKPEIFPIFDRFSREALYKICNNDECLPEIKTKKSLENYTMYAKTLDKLMKAWELPKKYRYKKIDEFLWSYGKQYNNQHEIGLKDIL